MIVITYNVRSFLGLTSGCDDGVVERRITSMAATLAGHDPDLICLQEAHHEQRVAQLARELGMDHLYFPGGDRWDMWPTGISGALLSRHPVVCIEPECGAGQGAGLFSRFWGYAVVDCGKFGFVALHCLHLHHIEADRRKREIEAVIARADRDLAGGLSAVAMGDLNHGEDTVEHRLWLESGWMDSLNKNNDPDRRTWPSVTPSERCDYIWARGQLAEHLAESRILRESPFSGSDALSDHLPVLARYA